MISNDSKMARYSCKLALSLVWSLLAASRICVATLSSGSNVSDINQCFTNGLPDGVAEWQATLAGSSISIEWTYGNETCNSVSSCLGLNVTNDVLMDPQILPVEIQHGVVVKFFPSNHMDVKFSMQPFFVSEYGFTNCSIVGGRPIVNNLTYDEITVKPEFLKPGVNYFIAHTVDPIFQCHYGLRLNITVKRHQCTRPGDTHRCSGHGRCLTRRTQVIYTCHCCSGYTGQYCEDIDACASNPCQNGGHCTDVPNDRTGSRFTCKCPKDFAGTTCGKKRPNICSSRPCENNATCSGDTEKYDCKCLPGFSGSHCEVNINECASNPCQNGYCVDKLAGYICICKPGHGGANCEQVYDRCASNPCKNGGECIAKGDNQTCHCGRGYEGHDCSVTVDLCGSGVCHQAYSCVNLGQRPHCVCHAGFTGQHCEININECDANPCRNEGKCRDEINGYKCICRTGFTGGNCATSVVGQLDNSRGHMVQYYSPNPHLHNLYVVAGTLAGALLIALLVLAGCYCRLHETYKKIGSGLLGICSEKKSRNVVDVSSVSQPRPSPDAIFEASTTDYHHNSLNAPLISSLKAKRI